VDLLPQRVLGLALAQLDGARVMQGTQQLDNKLARLLVLRGLVKRAHTRWRWNGVGSQALASKVEHLFVVACTRHVEGANTLALGALDLGAHTGGTLVNAALAL
jgi:hypothetical protein